MNDIERTIDSRTLIGYYDKHTEEYHDGYPVVKDPSALLDGITQVLMNMSGGVSVDNLLLYIMEDGNRDPDAARYILNVYRNPQNTVVSEYAIGLFYTDTGVLESASTIEEDNVQWSPDDLKNSLHPLRTKYYLGFVYLLCEKSPGFDQEARAEYELTGEDLITIGVQGTLPAEAISIPSLEDLEKDAETEEQAREEETENIGESELETVEEDDTDVKIDEYEAYEDDLATDYEELFEGI